MSSYSEKRKQRLVPLEGYNPSRPPIIRISREEANRYSAEVYARAMRAHAWRSNPILVKGVAKYSQELREPGA